MIFIDIVKKVLKFHIFSFIFVCILGSLLHFTFEWSNNNIFVGSFSAVNESTWEHLKLAFFPMLLTTIIGYFYIGKDFSNYLCARAGCIITTISFITVFFYAYTGILGTNYSILNIGSFFVAVFLGECTSFKKIVSMNNCNKIVAIIILLVLLIAFISFTYFTPEINFFRDPVTNSYGI
ncbi:MAG: hypothetical protein J6A89_07210 [Clostridia bacterium]|nr:hypothetical protein [Clostridia bacterium]